jgi:signal transduction histidine kinase
VPSDLNQIIKSVITFTSKEAAKHGIEFKTKLDLQLPAVPVDSEQMRQVLLNLILNAIHAMPQGGIVEIESRHSRNVVELTVRDDGVGIDPAIRDKIFDPFFTTKSEGSGLGLSVAYQLIKQHDGEIELVELNSPGALFVIRLPMTKTETAESPAKNDSHKTEAESKSSDSTAVRAEKL